MDAPRLVERNGTVYEQRPRARVEEPAAEIPCDSEVQPAAGETPARPRAEEIAAEIPCDSEVRAAAAQTPAPCAPTTRHHASPE